MTTTSSSATTAPAPAMGKIVDAAGQPLGDDEPRSEGAKEVQGVPASVFLENMAAKLVKETSQALGPWIEMKLNNVLDSLDGRIRALEEEVAELRDQSGRGDGGPEADRG